MDDDAGALRNHRRQQSAIETNCGHQVLVQFLGPLGVVERRESTARRAGAAEHVDEDVDAAELLIKAHGVISRNAIFPRSSRKTNRKSTGLPGKLPVSRLVTMYRPSFCSTANGSPVYEYLADAAVFHALMAAGPECVCPSSSTTPWFVKQRATASPSRLSASK